VDEATETAVIAFATDHPGSQDTCYVGNIKGVGRIYQQNFVDTCSKVAFAKLYTTKTPITSADLLNDRVLPFFEEQGLGMLRILTDRGTEYCGKVEQHDYGLFLAVNDIEHTKTKSASPQTNGICERFHEAILQEFHQVAFRRKLYLTSKELQDDPDEWLHYYNHQRTHQGKMCCGRTPIETLIAGREIWNEKVDRLNSIQQSPYNSKIGNCQIKSELLHINRLTVSAVSLFRINLQP